MRSVHCRDPFFFRYRLIRFDRDFFLIALGCFATLLLSASFSVNVIACYALLGLFVFNYLFFFVFPMNLFLYFDQKCIFRLYFSSFVVVGAFASAQVLCALWGIYLPYTTQRIGTLARGQGWSYEPSYYALYMIPCAIYWAMRYLCSRQCRLYPVVSSHLFLLFSTSATCLFAYGSWFVSLLAVRNIRMVRMLQLLSGLVFLGGSLLFLCPEWMTRGVIKYAAADFFVNSVLPRWEGIIRFWEIFLDNPILGAGLGGATTYYAQKQGIDLAMLDPEILDQNCPTNVATELLGSVGIVGMMMFGTLCFLIGKECIRVVHAPLAEEERGHLIALITSLFVLFVLLQFNPSMMRPYVWLHCALVLGQIKALRIYPFHLKSTQED
jgi:hypothetical protein